MVMLKLTLAISAISAMAIGVMNMATLGIQLEHKKVAQLCLIHTIISLGILTLFLFFNYTPYYCVVYNYICLY